MTEETLTVDQISEVFNRLLGINPRQADVQMIAILGGTREVLADYLWDHWLGEPDELEIKGIRVCRGSTAYARVKREWGFKGNRQRTLEQLRRWIDENVKSIGEEVRPL